MLLNFIKIAFRHLRRRKFTSGIHILGLSVAMTSFFLLMQYVHFESGYDSWHERSDRIVRVRFDRVYEDKHDKSAGVTPFVGPTLKQEYPEVAAYTKLWGTEHFSTLIKYRGESYRQENLYFADSSFFQVFSYPLLYGDPATVLSRPYSVVLTESAARRIFGEAAAAGKTVEIATPWGNFEFEVSGIAADCPENTHLKFEALISFSTLVQWTEGSAHDNRTGWHAFLTYLLLEPGTEVAALEAKLDQFVDQYYGDYQSERNVDVHLYLQPLEDIHLHSDLRFEPGVNGDARMINLLWVISFFILLIAWVNYINLSTAWATERSREVSIRKVAGARRFDLIRQFTLEALLVNVLSIGFAVWLSRLLLPWFGQLTGKEMDAWWWQDPRFLAGILIVLTLGVLLSGLYPAFVLSSFSPALVFKDKERTLAGLSMRRVLVVFQFTASAAMITATLIVYQQLRFMQRQDLGVATDQVLVVNGPGSTDSTYVEKLQVFRERLAAQKAITTITNATVVPGKEIRWVNNSVRWTEQPENELNSIPFIGVGDDFFETFQLQLKYGRPFVPGRPADAEKVLLSEATTRVLGFPEPSAAIGERIVDADQTYEVIGVTADFHQRSLRHDYDPVIFRYVQNADSYLALHAQPGSDWPALVEQVRQTWRAVFSGNPFEYFFLDEFFDRQYRADRQFGRTFGLFAALAIFIAVLGLLGLSSQVTLQRTKEIGIRKVLGATVASILLLLSREFIKLILLAILLALPLIYYFADSWLGDFPFRVSLEWWMFALPALLIILIAIFTVSGQALRTATSNPVEALRYE
jgi:putative ABC transport system permease protein